MKLRPSFWVALFAAVGPAVLVQSCSGADTLDPTIQGGNDASGGASSGGGGGFANLGVPTEIICDDRTDTDGDGIADEIEGDGDADGDGTPNKEDDDSDGDGVSDADERAVMNDDQCAKPSDVDGDQTFDFLDVDSDGDGLLDSLEDGLCPNADCRVLLDCDNDPEGVLDLIEVAAAQEGSDADPCDGLAPADAGLFFVVPFEAGPQQKTFEFSTGVRDADIYFLTDTTQSMQPAIDNIRDSLDTEIIPKVLNGDPGANPPIPPVPGAWIGIGDYKDVPWSPWGSPGDRVYGFKFDIGGNTVYGNVSPPVDNGGTLSAPDNVRQILNELTADGGGDAPESTTQALWLASTNEDYRAVGGGEPWPPSDPPGSGMFDAADWRQNCSDPSMIGRACFRAGKLPVFVIITDAGFHNGPSVAFDYIPPPQMPPQGGRAVQGTKTYQAVKDTLNTISAKIVGVPVNTGTPGQARNDLIKLAEDTSSFFFEPAFGAGETPLVADETSSGNVSTEVVRLIGLLAGLGVNNVTTQTTNYDCPGGVDCDGDGSLDIEYHNFTDQASQQPFDASQLIVDVATVESMAADPPYASRDADTFFGVRGDQTVEFEVTAQNDILETTQVVVVRALLQVQTPSGQALGGADGVKVIFLVIPPGRVVR